MTIIVLLVHSIDDSSITLKIILIHQSVITMKNRYSEHAT